MDQSERENLAFKASTVFTPAVPVNEKELFAGRLEQVERVIDAINQRGQHTIVFGERGVGKTSLANILASMFGSPRDTLAPKVNCDATDDFQTLWGKMLSKINLSQDKRPPGFRAEKQEKLVAASETLRENVTPDGVCRLLTHLGEAQVVIIIFDEFDRLKNQKARRAMADTIKALSDYDVPATLILVGVADTVDELIAEHRSIERSLVQIRMPRMSASELHEILDRGVSKLGMRIADDAKKSISLLSQGLPHYTHLLGLHAAREALNFDSKHIGLEQVRSAIKRAVLDAQQSLQSDYRKATISQHKDSIYPQVLLACALAGTDEFGYFAAADVRGPLSEIMRRRYEIPSFAKHLNDFCQSPHGNVLTKTGIKRKFRYRFTNPLIQPFVIMKGLADGRIDEAALKNK
jgi:Cdc6-like AAA superfamily ATPase